jgi:carboxyl-terminal processing protease
MRSKRFFVGIVCVLTGFLLLAAGPSDKYFEIAKNLDIFTTLFKEVNKYYVDEINPTELVNTGITSMLSTLDPYTNYIPEDLIDDYKTMTTGEYGGIGAVIGKKNEKIIILLPNRGYIAHKAGLQIGDELLTVNGQPVAGKEVNEVSKLLKGQPGSEITLTIKRYGVTELLTLKLQREKIHLNNVPYYGMVSPEIGFIQLTDFTQDASKEVKNALADLKAKGAQKIILDLRGNPGGLLHEAINTANLFLPKGSEVVSTKGKITEWNKTHRALNAPVDLEIPLVVLINRGSASAAEIVSGVIQDYDRGVVIGKRSFGKGLVQQTLSLAYNSKLKVTVAKYYIPSGRCIQELDYSHKNEMGMAGKVPDSLRVAFKTKGGRVVYDGGGVDPDVMTDTRPYAPITRSLLSKGLIFDYASVYKFKHKSIPPSTQFKLTDKEYDDFVKWLEDKDYDYTTRVEEMLGELIANAKKEQYYEDVKVQIYDLERKITHNKEFDLKKFKQEIKEELEMEIAKRYYLEAGEIEASFDDDPDIQQAIEILKDEQRYKGILMAKKI